MKREHLRRIIERNRAVTEPSTAAEVAQGFKGWHASKHLPHFDSSGAQQFITYRLDDALARGRRSEWEEFLTIEDERERQIAIEDYLDRGDGECHLRDPRIADLVQENFWRHDGANYRLHGWVVMPNHVHILVEVWHVPTPQILHSWKGYTAKAANRLLNRKGTFWQDDYFDRYIRNERHYQRAIRYIEQNPVKAGLVSTAEQWRWSSARFRALAGASHRVRNLAHPTANRVPQPPPATSEQPAE